MSAGMNNRKQIQRINREDLRRAQVCRTGMMEIEALKINRKSGPEKKIKVIDRLTKERRQVHPVLRGNG